MMLELRYRHETAGSPMVVSGGIGPRGDGYDPGELMRPTRRATTTGRRSAPSATPAPT